MDTAFEVGAPPIPTNAPANERAATATETRLRFVETKVPLVFEQIDFTIDDPEYLAMTVGAPLEYAQRVEALVGHTAMGDLMPRRDSRIDRFLATWTTDELGHARALGELMRLLGLDSVDLADFTPPAHNRWIPVLGRLSSSLHDVTSVIWATSGAMNEHLALGAYSRIDSILRHRNERALHETLFRRLRAHESAHKGFYTAFACEMWGSLRPWQKRLTRYVLARIWAPVGATDEHDKPAFARTIAALEPEHWRESVVDPLRAIAERILEHDGRPLDDFVERAVVECLESDPAGRRILAAAA
jgi:hypothetical protein